MYPNRTNIEFFFFFRTLVAMANEIGGKNGEIGENLGLKFKAIMQHIG